MAEWAAAVTQARVQDADRGVGRCAGVRCPCPSAPGVLRRCFLSVSASGNVP